MELELQLVDPQTLDLVAAADEVLASVPVAMRESVKPEFYPAAWRSTPASAGTSSRSGSTSAPSWPPSPRWRPRHGARLAWGGTHPFAHWLDQPITPDPRYLELAKLLRETLCRQLTFGLHVHVGVEDGDAAVRACNGLSEHLPALLALRPTARSGADAPPACTRTGSR